MCISILGGLLGHSHPSDSCIQQYGNVTNYYYNCKELAALPFLCYLVFSYSFLTQEDFSITCSFTGLGLKNGLAATPDMSLLSFSYAAYCSIKFAKKAIKGKII